MKVFPGPMPEDYKFPSRFGSHQSMVDRKMTAALGEPDKAVLRDEFGSYVTSVKMLDNGKADGNRWNVSRVRRFVKG
jgi:hypothetical protein